MIVSQAKNVPTGFQKYFRVGNLKEFTDANITSDENISLVEEFTVKILEAYGRHLCGWAFAKEAYVDVLSEANLATLAIVRRGREKRELWDVDFVSGKIQEVTLDEIKSVINS